MPRRLSVRPPTDPAVQASSTLTIVRVASPPKPHHHRPDRLSFAHASFGPPSPPSSPRARPSSPVPHLSSDQLVSLARASTRCPPATASTTFTPLPDDILLPFIDRPSEVAALIATPPSAKLFSLLEKTLAPITEPATDPSLWTYTQLRHHLTHVSRHQASDPVWVLQARRCIISHSELIWERVKGALGVPPELDVDYDPHDCASSHSSIDTDEISDDHGRSARGHWPDWDAIMDSPLYARRHSGPGSPVLPLSLSRQQDPVSPEHRPVSPSTLLSIEPLLTTQPHSDPGAPGLGDIQETAEEDEEQDQEPEQESHDPHLVTPSSIHGLRISTTRVSLSDLSGSVSSSDRPLSPIASSGSLPQPLSPISPLPPYVYPAPRSRPPSGTFVRPQLGSYGPGSPPRVFRRSGSSGSLMSLRGHTGDHEGDGYASDGGHDRSPLFPSSFARLSAEPTLTHGESAHKQGATGGSVSGYKRLSWGTHPAVATSKE